MTLTPLSAKVSGYIATVAVQDFSTVRAGDVLAAIDPADYRAQLTQAEANRAAAEAGLADLVNQKAVQRAVIRQAEATIEATSADVTRFQLEASRQRASPGPAALPERRRRSSNRMPAGSGFAAQLS